MTVQSLAPILRFVLAERGWPCPDRLERLAAYLPAVATAGLEVALESEGAIDLQQRIQNQEEIARLARWLARTGPQGAAWQHLAAALAPIADAIDEYWLELDAPAGDDARDAPLSVFVRLRDYAEPTIARVLAAFDIRLTPERLEALQRCLVACGPDARLSYIGLMLGRAGAPLRLIVENVRPNDACAFLERSGWPGPLDTATAWIDRLFVHADRIRFALTLGDALTPDIGFECFVGDPTANDPRWRCLFDMLVQGGLCTPARREQLLAWPAALTPLSSQQWPESLISDALLRPATAPRWLDCRISHAKVTLAAGHPPRAKGYFGFIEVQAPSVADTEARPRTTTTNAKTAIENATDFLVAGQNQAGWWLDYDGFSEGTADEWVTAYVAHALHDSARADARDGAARAWHLLKARARSGWGWNFLQPADADSTIWGLRLASDLSQSETREAREATEFLRQHLDADGGIATYRRHVYAQWVDAKAVNPAWYDAHACVTAAAAHVPGLGLAPLSYVRSTQRENGEWRGYWWQSDRYTTALAAEALAATGDAEDANRVQRAVAATRAWLERDGWGETLREPPFDAAWALRTLLLRPMDGWETIERLADHLQHAGREDGSWVASAALAIPNRQGDIVQAIDSRRYFTTATVLSALRKFENLRLTGH
ncbi:MAG: hypothetical protein V4472_26345 [Pseudomonadota bacterium]